MGYPSDETIAEAHGWNQDRPAIHDKTGIFLKIVHGEVESARSNWPEFNSAHEGFAILKEEVDELWDCVKTNQKRRDIEKMKVEAIQVAAMAIRFAMEVCNEEVGRK